MHSMMAGRARRYGYSLAGGASPTYNNTLAKYDVETGETSIWHEPGCLPTGGHLIQSYKHVGTPCRS